MRVLQVTTHFNIGGISNYILTLSKALESKGVKTIVASAGGDLQDSLVRYHIPHYYLNMKTKFEFGPRVIVAGCALANLIKREKIDIIHAHSRVSQVAAAIASLATGVPYVTTCHGYFKKRSRGLIDTWGAKVIAISKAVKTHLERDLNVKSGRIELIYSGVDAAHFERAYSADEIRKLKKEMWLHDGPVVGTIGRLSIVKGQRYLVEAMQQVVAKVPDVQAVIVGTGEEEEALRHLAGSLGIAGSVLFIPSCPDTHKFLSVMDVFVFPSVKEGLGIALLEAMAAARACVASRIGGIENIIKDGRTGILTDVGDVDAIAKGILRLLNDEKLRKEMGSSGRKLVKEQFTLDLMAENIAKLYKDIIKQ